MVRQLWRTASSDGGIQIFCSVLVRSACLLLFGMQPQSSHNRNHNLNFVRWCLPIEELDLISGSSWCLLSVVNVSKSSMSIETWLDKDPMGWMARVLST